MSEKSRIESTDTACTLISVSCTTSWFDWIHGELWICPNRFLHKERPGGLSDNFKPLTTLSAMTSNSRGRPLTSHEVVVELIGTTTTRAGLTVHAEVDTNAYPRGFKVSDAEMEAIRPQIEPDAFHSEWNYTLRPPTTA